MALQWEDAQKAQPVALKIFQNSFVNNRLAHAYLFEGMRGTGKRQVGLLIAMSYFCDTKVDNYKPCGQCSHCRRIISGNHPDVYIVEPDGLSIKKEQISKLQAEFSKTGLESNKKFYMIVDANKMTVNAANSLLKFLEEPNKQTVAILLTEYVQQIIPTILSRCQIITFQPLAPEVLIERLTSEGVSPSQALILSELTNNVEDALILNSDEWFVQAQKKVLKLYEITSKRTHEVLIMLQTEWLDHFSEKNQIDQGLNLLLLIYKDVLNIQLEKSEQKFYPHLSQLLESEALRTPQEQLVKQMEAIFEAKRKLQANVNPQLLMEQLVLKLQEGSSFV